MVWSSFFFLDFSDDLVLLLSTVIFCSWPSGKGYFAWSTNINWRWKLGGCKKGVPQIISAKIFYITVYRDVSKSCYWFVDGGWKICQCLFTYWLDVGHCFSCKVGDLWATLCYLVNIATKLSSFADNWIVSLNLNHIFNFYMTKFFTICSLLSQGLAGIQPVDISGIENVSTSSHPNIFLL